VIDVASISLAEHRALPREERETLLLELHKRKRDHLRAHFEPRGDRAAAGEVDGMGQHELRYIVRRERLADEAKAAGELEASDAIRSMTRAELWEHFPVLDEDPNDTGARMYELERQARRAS
jgi:hypothetical protein